jgi:pilus assembly protein CpaC
MLHQTGQARVSRHVVLVAANGALAEFDSGGDIYVPVPGQLGSNELRSVHFGSRLSVTPRFDPASRRIELEVNATISQLTETGQSVPGTSRTMTNTTANLELGQSMALAGFSSEDSRSARGGLPGLSQIPILGILFGTHTHSATSQESVLIIVPSVVEAADGRQRRLVEEALAAYNDASAGDGDLIDLAGTVQAGQ